MEPISWSVVASLLLKYGPEVADFVARKWKAGKEVSLEEIEELKALASKTPESQLLEAISRNGLSLESEHVKNLLSMLPQRVTAPSTLPTP